MKNKLNTVCILLLFLWAKPLFGQELDWVLVWGNITSQGMTDLKVDTLGNIYSCGFYTGTFDFDPSANVNEITGGANGEFFIAKHDSLGNLLWVNGFAGSGVGRVHQMALDNNQSVIVTGYFGDEVDFDPTPGVEMLIEADSYDCFVLKVDKNGNLEWVHTFGDSSVDQGHNIVTDANNNIYVTGRFLHNQDFDPGPGVHYLEPYPYPTQFNTFVLKLNSAGEFVWANKYGNSWSYGMGYDPTGNILITGRFADDFDAGIGAAEDSLYINGMEDIFVIKIDTNGNHQWAKSYSGPSYDHGEDIIANSLGEIYVTGGFRYNANFGTTGSPINVTAGGLYDHFILKLNPDGTTQWITHCGSDVAIGKALALDEAENIIAVGYFENEDTDFNPGTGDSILTNGGMEDMFYQCLNSDGEFLFAGKVGDISGEGASGVDFTKEGKIVIGGGFTGVTDFDPGPGVQQEFCQGQNDPFILKLTASPYSTPVDYTILAANSIQYFSVYPNPTNSTVTILLNGNHTYLAKAELFDLTGKKIMTSEFQNSVSLAIYNLPVGIYLLKISSPDYAQTVKLLITE